MFAECTYYGVISRRDKSSNCNINDPGLNVSVSGMTISMP